jgi:hypothetical protein
MQLTVVVDKNNLSTKDWLSVLIYSIPVSNNASGSSDATHSNIDNNGYQVAG